MKLTGNDTIILHCNPDEEIGEKIIVPDSEDDKSWIDRETTFFKNLGYKIHEFDTFYKQEKPTVPEDAPFAEVMFKTCFIDHKGRVISFFKSVILKKGESIDTIWYMDRLIESYQNSDDYKNNPHKYEEVKE